MTNSIGLSIKTPVNLPSFFNISPPVASVFIVTPAKFIAV